MARGETLSSFQLDGLVVVGVLAVLLGAARAATVRLYLRDGVLWYRYRLLTYVTWGVTALVGMGARLATYELTELPDSGRSLYLSVGLTLAGESLVLAARGFLSGERFAAQRRDSQAARQVIHDQMRARLRHVPPRDLGPGRHHAQVDERPGPRRARL